MINWAESLWNNRSRLDDDSKLKILTANLVYMSPFLSFDEARMFLTMKEDLSNPESLVDYSILEEKIAYAYSCVCDEKWEKEKHIEIIREALGKLYSPSQLDEIESLLLSTRDVVALAMSIAGDHNGMRRIRNAYLPKITDLIGINLETGKSGDLTKNLFQEGSGDAVSRIERLLGTKDKSNP